MRVRAVSLFVCLLAVAGCNRSSAPAAKAPPKPAPVDPWVLATLDPSADEPALLWNGLIGVRLARNGSGLAADGKPLGFFMIDEYETSGEEKIRTLPNPLAQRWVAGQETLLDPSGAADYRQQIDMRTGILRTSWTQRVESKPLQVTAEAVIDPNARVVATRWSFAGDVAVRAILERGGPTPVGKGADGEWRFEVGPGRTKMRLAVRGAEAVADDGVLAQLQPAGGGASVEMVASFGVGSNRVTKAAKEPPRPPTYDDVARNAAAVWKERWKTDIEIDGPVADQQAVRSFLFYLRSAIHPEGDMAVSPFALSSQQYNGHVFWDADIWVFPALALVDPAAAREIPDYRLRTARQAGTNFNEWLAAGRPTHSGKLGTLSGLNGGVKYPWESSVSGKETVPGPSRFEDHITGSVAFMLRQASALALAPATQVPAIRRGAATFFAARSQPGSAGREIRDLMSPDENHIGDNDLYTNLLAQSLAGEVPASEPLRFRLPKDADSFLTYDNDPIRGYKQAAAVLAIYPLQFPEAERQARTMMERFADKVTPNGPAMSDSVHALIWARLGERDKAYETWRKSWVEFTDQPLMLFSEKRKKATSYFTTGAGGSLQTVLFGFLGFRLDWKEEPDAVWSTKLDGDAWLSIKPNLPRSWKSVKFRNFTVQNRRYTLTATPSAVRVVPGE